MTASLCLHGALFQLSAFPENSGSISIDVRDRFNGAINSVTFFTGSEQVAREIYEALGPIFHRHGGAVGKVHVRPARPQEPPQTPEPAPAADKGWIEWGGGDCPVGHLIRLRVKTRCNVERIGLAGDFYWAAYGGPGEITAYRFAEEEG